MLTEATKANLRRKSAYVDHVQLGPDGKPLFSWCDLSLTELCNRSGGSKNACVFCPRIDPRFYPNQKLHMSLDLVRKIAEEADTLKYEGVFVLCGFGEPLLHPQIIDVVGALKKTDLPVNSPFREKVPWRVEIVTNGDALTVDLIRELAHAGCDYFVVSMYDGPEQEAKFIAMFQQADCYDYLLRDRWHSEADSFGLKLTNRAGTVGVGDQDEVDTTRACHYLAYQMTTDWNGDVVLCPQDWHKRLRFGNLNVQSMYEVWRSPAMHKRRMQLLRGRGGLEPCQHCNVAGDLHGFAHVPVWEGRKDTIGQERSKLEGPDFLPTDDAATSGK